MQVDPANRLVADSLEADWNASLRALEAAQQQYQHYRAADRLVLDDEQREQIAALATDFPTAWRDPSTPQRERKRMLALVIEDVTLIKEREVTAAVRFRGGATKTLTLPRPLTAQQRRATDPEVRRQIDTLLDDYTDADVARILNRRGLQTGAGDAFEPQSVQWVRFSAKLESLEDRLRAAGWLSAREIFERFGFRRGKLGRMRREGTIEARICNGRGQWLYWPPGTPRTQPTHPLAAPSPQPADRSTARDAL
jgi:hypothetical protein